MTPPSYREVRRTTPRLSLLRAFALLSVAFSFACVPERPAEGPTVLESSPGIGGEVQSRDGLEAERAMWKNCRKGYVVLREEPIVVGARTTPTPANTLLGLRDDTTTTYVTESRVRYRCVDPDREVPPKGSVLPARVERS